ncbi:MAG: ribosome maturation factor RimM [Cyanobacteria bacterium J06632_3]
MGDYLEAQLDKDDQANRDNAAHSDDDWVLIGRIVGAHGLNGHVKVYPESDFPERFIQPGERWIKKPNSHPQPVRLTSGRYLEGKNNYLVKLAGIDYRDQAEDLRSAQLLVPAKDRLPLEPGEFHVNDLVGLRVVIQESQVTLGTVTNIFTTGHDLLEVTLAAPTDKGDHPKETIEPAAKSASGGSSNTSSDVFPNSSDASPDSSLRAKAAQKLRRKAKREQKKKKPKTLLIPFVEEIVPVVDIEAGRIEITPPPGLMDL